jgi:hypothetical protein
MQLVGKAGVYSYDAGFQRHGASAVMGSSKAGLRMMLADDTSRNPGGYATAPDLSDFAAGSAPDTLVYDTFPSVDGSDVLAVELMVDLGAADVGYTRRDERGLNPGSITQVTRTGSGFDTARYATRENRSASAVWLSYEVMQGWKAAGAYGWGGTTAQAYAQERTSSTLPPAEFDGAGTPVDAGFSVGTTDRAVLSLGTTGTGTGGALRWDYTSWDFDGVAGMASADVNRATLTGRAGWKGWEWTGSAEYTRARYNDTPDALDVDWPEQNVWLSLWDTFNPERLLAANLDTYTIFRLGAATDGERVDAAVDLTCVTDGVAASFAQASARAWVEWAIRGPWRMRADSRTAGYQAGKTYESFYIEAGWKSDRLQANLGFGFDPIVFDPVISDYADIGRQQTLRAALDNGFARSHAASIAADVQAQEQILADVRLIKLEIVVRLP